MFQRLRYWLRGTGDEDLREELEFHRARLQEQLEHRGAAPDAARAASRRAMGNVTMARQDARDIWMWRWLDMLHRDIRYGVRLLRREPTFALTAIVTLALGVATTTTVFSVVDAALWKPLPYPHPERLVQLYVGPDAESGSERISVAELRAWRDTPAMDGIAGVGETERRVLRGATAESVLVTHVTPNYFDVLGRRAREGRALGAETGRAPEAVITETARARLFDRDPTVVGRTIMLDTEPVTIVGVVAPDTSLGMEPDLYVAIDEAAAAAKPTVKIIETGIGRLSAGTTPAAGRAALQVTASRFKESGRSTPRIVFATDLREVFAGYKWRALYFFLGASLLVLLLACANVASLLLARALGRDREFAIRGALGGGSGSLARQLVIEALLVAMPAGGVALLVTRWTLQALATRLPEVYAERTTSIPVDGRVAAYALAVSALTAIAFGLVPSLAARRINVNAALGRGGRTAGSPTQTRGRTALLVAQVALTTVLLVGAALFLRSYTKLLAMPLGFDPHGRLSLRVTLSGPRYESDDAVRAYASRLTEAASAVPGVRRAVVATSSPLASGHLVRLVRPGTPRPQPGHEPEAIIRAVGHGYFATVGTSILRGRGFTPDDVEGAPRVTVINETLAATVFPGADPLGKTIELLPNNRAQWTRRPGALLIVGIASNVKEVGMNEVAFNDFYVPFRQMPAPAIELIVLTSSQAAAPLRRAAAAVDPAIPVGTVKPLESRSVEALREDRFNTLVISWFAGVALLLAGVGVYGAVAYAVQQRTREFGVRVALGARPRAIVGAAVRQAGRVGVTGGACGLAAALVAARLLGNSLYLVRGQHEGLLYGVRTTDPASLTVAFAGVLLVALIAAIAPARRIARIDPVIALRVE